MVMSQEALHVVNSIQGVIKFVGTGKLPQPLRQDEVNRLLGIAEAVAEAEPKEEIPFMVGQVVEITEGPFSDFSGTVEEVLADKGKVKVSVQPVRPADGGGAGLPAAEGALERPRDRAVSRQVRSVASIVTARPDRTRLDAPIRGAAWQRRSRHW